MPKQVDHEERRRVLAEAIYEVIGTRGFDAVSLRDIAKQAGVSMGAVQHYFATKDEMLLFALGHMRTRVLQRLQATMSELPQPARVRDTVRHAFGVMLPIDEAGRQEACVNIAFFTLASVHQEYADQLLAGYERILAVTKAAFITAQESGELADGIDPAMEATSLYFLVQGFVGPLLIGLFTPEEVVKLIDRQLDRVFR